MAHTWTGQDVENPPRQAAWLNDLEATAASGVPGPAGPPATNQYTLNASTSIADTTATLDRTPSNSGLKVGDYVAIGAGTSNCEVRRVTALSTATVTLHVALKIAHSSTENVWVTPGYWVPLEWWGAVADGSTDSYRSLINASIDQVEAGNQYGLVGHQSYYATTRPLFWGDYSAVHEVSLLAKSPFSIDCTIGKDTVSGIPNQVLLTIAGQYSRATFNLSTDIVTFLDTGVGGVNSDVVFYPRPGSTMPGGIEEGRRYFTLTGGTTTTQITLSQGSSTPVDITSAGSGDIIAVSTSLARMRSSRCRLNGNWIQGLSGMAAIVQQPSYADDLRIESFPVIGIPQLGAQQGDFDGLMVFQCGYAGIEFAGAEMIYMSKLNVEQCDTLIIFAETARNLPESVNNQGCVLGPGVHFETAGGGSSLIQTLTPTGTISSGTFQYRFFNVLTAAINWNDTAAQLQTKLQAHASIGSGNVTCTQVTGTNISDGPITIDFTVGALNWSLFLGSTNTRIGGQLAIANSTIAGGGSLAMSYINTTDAYAIDYRKGVGNWISGVLCSTHLLKTSGSAIDSSEGPHQGYTLQNVYFPSQGCTAVNDSFHGELLSAADIDCSQYIGFYERPGRHASGIGQHDYFVGDGGRKVKRNAAGQPLVEQIASSTQTDDLHAWTGTAGTVGLRISPNSYLIVKRNAAPVTSILSAGEAALWFDSTNGAAKLMITAKQADGTVKTGSFNVQT